MTKIKVYIDMHSELREIPYRDSPNLWSHEKSLQIEPGYSTTMQNFVEFGFIRSSEAEIFGKGAAGRARIVLLECPYACLNVNQINVEIQHWKSPGRVGFLHMPDNPKDLQRLLDKLESDGPNLYAVVIYGRLIRNDELVVGRSFMPRCPSSARFAYVPSSVVIAQNCTGDMTVHESLEYQDSLTRNDIKFTASLTKAVELVWGAIGQMNSGDKAWVQQWVDVRKNFEIAQMLHESGSQTKRTKRTKMTKMTKRTQRPKSTRLLCRRGGVKRLSGSVYAETNTVLHTFMEHIIRDAVTYTEHARRKTVAYHDVLYALKRNGRSMYM